MRPAALRHACQFNCSLAVDGTFLPPRKEELENQGSYDSPMQRKPRTYNWPERRQITAVRYVGT